VSDGLPNIKQTLTSVKKTLIVCVVCFLHNDASLLVKNTWQCERTLQSLFIFAAMPRPLAWFRLHKQYAYGFALDAHLMEI
jgi:hypothetical protein